MRLTREQTIKFNKLLFSLVNKDVLFIAHHYNGHGLGSRDMYRLASFEMACYPSKHNCVNKIIYFNNGCKWTFIDDNYKSRIGRHSDLYVYNTLDNDFVLVDNTPESRCK